MGNVGGGGGAGVVRVAIADDSAFMRTALRRMLETDPMVKVVAIAKNGLEAIDVCKMHRPDVLTLDVEMPEMDGLSALKRIQCECVPPPAVLMCSSLTKAGSHEALTALRLGAADVIAKDGSSFSLNVEGMRDDLIAKVRAVAHGRMLRGAAAPRPAMVGKEFKVNSAELSLVVIGASTGGPPVLETIVTGFTAGLHVPVVIAQHMPPIFTASLAERLNKEAKVPVVHGEHGMKVVAGTVYIAPGGQHTRVKGMAGRMTLDISKEPLSAIYKPSVDELFRSASVSAGSRVLGIICTGMGEDGAIGAKDLKRAGGLMIAQDVSSCVVYGMPKAVAQAGLADAMMNPDEIARVVSTIRGAARSAA